jgi:hypothetical protein
MSFLSIAIGAHSPLPMVVYTVPFTPSGDIDEAFFQAVVQQAYFPNTSFSSVCVVAESRLSLTSTVSARSSITTVPSSVVQ